MDFVRRFVDFCLVLAVFLVTAEGFDTMSSHGGAEVVAEVSKKDWLIRDLSPDHKFLCRIAWVESKYGTDPRTYRTGYYGGIWQVWTF